MTTALPASVRLRRLVLDMKCALDGHDWHSRGSLATLNAAA